jgi:tRNA-dihydrouridine synthase
VTVKIRLQPLPGDTVRFAVLLAKAGASLVSVHGRQRGREDRRRDGSADLGAVAEVVAALAKLGVPVVANGNVRCPGDVRASLAATGAAGVMVAEQILRDPAVFARARRELIAVAPPFSGDGAESAAEAARAAEAAAAAAPEVPSVRRLVDEYAALIEALDAVGDAAAGGDVAGGDVAGGGVAGPRLR